MQIKYSNSCDLSTKLTLIGTDRHQKALIRYIHNKTGPVPALSKTDRPGDGAANGAGTVQTYRHRPAQTLFRGMNDFIWGTKEFIIFFNTNLMFTQHLT